MYPPVSAPPPVNAPSQPGQYAPTQTQQLPVAPPQAPIQPQQQLPQAPAQPTQSVYPTFNPIAPGPNQQPGPQVVPPQAPSQQPAAPAAGRYDEIYAAVSQELNIPIEQVRANLQDDPRAFGRILKAAVSNLPQQQPTAPVQPTPAATTVQAPQEVPAIAFQYMKRNDAGLWEATNPQAAPYAQLQNNKEWAEREKAQKFISDPTSIFQDPSVAKMIQEQIDKRVNEATAAQQLEHVRQTYRTKFSPVILQLDPQGRPMQGFDGKPVLTPLGASFEAHSKALYGRGMAESPELYEAAMAMAEREHPQQQQQQQPQQQQPQQFNPLGIQLGGMQQQPLTQPGFQGGYPQQQQVNPQQGQFPQVPQNPALHAMIRRNLTSQTYQPGMAPQRAAQPIRGLPLREALQMTIQQQGVPDGQPMEAYWGALFGNR